MKARSQIYLTDLIINHSRQYCLNCMSEMQVKSLLLQTTITYSGFYYLTNDFLFLHGK